MVAPLAGITIVDFSQFLAGPYAALRLLDMGARVIKVENPAHGDLSRTHYLSDTMFGGDSTLFHAINRGKESIALNLKSPEGRADALALSAQADVVIQNFRPGVIERLGLGYDAVEAVNPDVIYGSVSGYGPSGDWAALPGQDLLAQARSGVMWLSGNAGTGPVPIGLPVADISAGAALAQGLLGALFHHARTGQGMLVETSLLEAIVDLQFELLSTYLNNGHRPPERLPRGSAHGYLDAPYGVYQTADGALALAMTPTAKLAEALDLPALVALAGVEPPARKAQAYDLLTAHIATRPAAEWEDHLRAQGIWCARVLDWAEMLQSPSFQALGMVARGPEGRDTPPATLHTPIRMNGSRQPATCPAPRLDEHGDRLRREFSLS